MVEGGEGAAGVCCCRVGGGLNAKEDTEGGQAAGIKDGDEDDANFPFFIFFFLLLVAKGTAGEEGAAGCLGLALCGKEDMEGGGTAAAAVDDGRFRFLDFLLLVVAVALLLSSCEGGGGA